ncbi:UNKNOWN [Stylonychia lemnae]|uniref:Uncharacterized protein n=1 Tax=Stylonychia lemnae TaxID=5949 RepID=A0A078AEP3_STYLE|nr:UNKNOWN [Stylonychia lemnae]|eukprot:CDW80311.1 UNKNOWN [Stylonychia lemnae]
MLSEEYFIDNINYDERFVANFIDTIKAQQTLLQELDQGHTDMNNKLELVKRERDLVQQTYLSNEEKLAEQYALVLELVNQYEINLAKFRSIKEQIDLFTSTLGDFNILWVHNLQENRYDSQKDQYEELRQKIEKKYGEQLIGEKELEKNLYQKFMLIIEEIEQISQGQFDLLTQMKAEILISCEIDIIPNLEKIPFSQKKELVNNQKKISQILMSSDMLMLKLRIQLLNQKLFKIIGIVENYLKQYSTNKVNIKDPESFEIAFKDYDNIKKNYPQEFEKFIQEINNENNENYYSLIQQKNKNESLENFFQQQKALHFSLKDMKYFIINNMEDIQSFQITRTELLWQEFIDKYKPTIKIQRMQGNNYRFGDRLITTKIIDGELCVKLGRTSITLEKYYNIHYQKVEEQQKILELTQSLQKKQGFDLNTYNTNSSSDTNKAMKVFTKFGQQQLQFLQQQQSDSIQPQNRTLMNTPSPSPSSLELKKMSSPLSDPKNDKELIGLLRKSIALRHSPQTKTNTFEGSNHAGKLQDSKQQQRVIFKSRNIKNIEPIVSKVSQTLTHNFLNHQSLISPKGNYLSVQQNNIPRQNGDQMQFSSRNRLSIASQNSVKETQSNDSSNQRGGGEQQSTIQKIQRKTISDLKKWKNF